MTAQGSVLVQWLEDDGTIEQVECSARHAYEAVQVLRLNRFPFLIRTDVGVELSAVQLAIRASREVTASAGKK